MADESDRVTVSTYLPASQRKRWQQDAETLGMSQSEFVRSMVQAGRRGFNLDGEPEAPVETDVAGSNPRGNDLRTTVLELLREEGRLTWADLVEELTDQLEAELEETLRELESEDLIHFSHRGGDYRITEGSNGE